MKPPTKRPPNRPALPGWAAAAVLITGSLQLPGCGDTEEDRGQTLPAEAEDAGGTDAGSTADASDAASDAANDVEPQDAAGVTDAEPDDASIVDPGICPV